MLLGIIKCMEGHWLHLYLVEDCLWARCLCISLNQSLNNILNQHFLLFVRQRQKASYVLSSLGFLTFKSMMKTTLQACTEADSLHNSILCNSARTFPIRCFSNEWFKISIISSSSSNKFTAKKKRRFRIINFRLMEEFRENLFNFIMKSSGNWIRGNWL